MINKEEFKNNVYNTYESIIDFKIAAGEEVEKIREYLIELINDKIDRVNNPREHYDRHYEKMIKADVTYKYNFIYTDTSKLFDIAEIEGLTTLLNEYPESIIIAGAGILNDEKANYSWVENYHYVLYTPESKYCKYALLKELKNEEYHKINNKKSNRFAVDHLGNIYITKAI